MLAAAVIALAMSTDAFAAALGKGAALDRPRLAEALRTGLIFGSVEGVAPLVGWVSGLAAGAYLEAVDHWIAFTLLGLLGVRMIVAGPAERAGKDRARRHSLPVLAATAFATSIDALAVGLTLALLDADIVVTAAAIGFATFVMATLGVMVGRAAGACLGRAAEAAGGVVLIAVGTSILVQHLGLLSG